VKNLEKKIGVKILFLKIKEKSYAYYSLKVGRKLCLLIKGVRSFALLGSKHLKPSPSYPS
jgi:hypothetical protein